MAPRTCYAPSKSYENYPAHPSLGLKRCNVALNLLNSHLSQHSLRNRWAGQNAFRYGKTLLTYMRKQIDNLRCVERRNNGTSM